MNLYQKINQVMKEVKSVKKDVTITMPNGRSYKGTSHDDVTYLLHEPVVNSGIVLAPSVIDSRLEISKKEKEYNGKIQISYEYISSVMVELVAINSENPDERLSVKMPAMAIDNGDKAHGKAISMATKYCYLKLFMLESFDEEEARPDASYQQKPRQDYQAKTNTIDKIKTELAKQTQGQTVEQKTKFMQEKLKVNSFKDLEKQTDAQLMANYVQLTMGLK